MTLPVALPLAATNRASPFLFEWDCRTFLRTGSLDAVTGQVATFTRASKGCSIDANGNPFQVAHSQPRIFYGSDGEPSLWLSRAGTNLCLQSENFGTTWSAIGTPTRSAAANNIGNAVLDLIGDDSGAAAEGYSQVITFTGDGVKAVPLFVAYEPNLGLSVGVRVRDTTAGANRLALTISFTGSSAEALSVSMTTGTNLLDHIAPKAIRGVDRNGVAGWWLWLQTTSVTAANTNQVEVYPASTASLTTTFTGDVYAGGVQAENAEIPAGYIPTTTGTVTRSADFLSFPALWKPQDLTIYIDHTELGTLRATGGKLLQLGDDDSGTSDCAIISAPSAGDIQATYNNATVGTLTSDVTSGDVALLDRHETRVVVTSTTMYVGRSINAATEAVDASPAGAMSHPLAYAEQVLTFTPGGTFTGSHGIRRVRIAPGVRTLTEMRTGRW